MPNVILLIILVIGSCYQGQLNLQKNNDISRKLGLQLQNELLSGIRSLKLRPNIKEYRYVHDDSHFGWLLLDPALTNRFN